LAYNVHTKNSLGDTLVLYFGGMLETTVYYGSETLGLEDEIFES